MFLSLSNRKNNIPPVHKAKLMKKLVSQYNVKDLANEHQLYARSCHITLMAELSNALVVENSCRKVKKYCAKTTQTLF